MATTTPNHSIALIVPPSAFSTPEGMSLVTGQRQYNEYKAALAPTLASLADYIGGDIVTGEDAEALAAVELLERYLATEF